MFEFEGGNVDLLGVIYVYVVGVCVMGVIIEWFCLVIGME